MNSFLNVFVNRKMLALLLLGFASGLPSQVIDVTLRTWLTSAGVEVDSITKVASAASGPYAFKFAWSPLLDRYAPPFLGRRRGWLLLTQLVIIAAMVLLAFQAPSNTNLSLFTALAAIIGFFSASQDIAADAYRTDVLTKPEKGAGAAVFILGFRLAILFASGVILVWTDPKIPGHISWNTAYLVLAGLMLIGLITSLWAPQPKDENVAPKSLLDAVVLPFQDFFQRKGLATGVLILLFIVIYKIGDYMVKSVSPTFLLKAAHYSQTEMGAAQGVSGIIATIIGALVGGAVLAKIGLNRSLWLSSVLLAVGILPYVLLAQAAQGLVGDNNPGNLLLQLAVITEYFFAGMESTVFVAFMMDLCDQRFSATQYALFSSLMLAGKSFVTAPMGSVAKSIGWPSFFLLSAFSAIPGLILLSIIAPLDAKKLMRSGLLAKDAKNSFKAFDNFDHVIDLQPNNAEAYHQRGLVNSEIGKRSRDRVNSMADAKEQSGKAQEAVLHYADAIKDLKKSMELNPSSTAILPELDMVQADAKVAYDRAIELTPDPEAGKANGKANFYGERAVIQANLGSWAEARADLDLAIKLEPQDVRFFEDRGKVRSHLQDYPGALADLQQAIKLAPNDVDHYKDWAWVNCQIDQSKAATNKFQQAIKLDPNDAEITEKLAAFRKSALLG
jgi:MFS transporter, PAT family, beta-lactamase induction signal transducer AmpG